jgi:hypothetical protein
MSLNQHGLEAKSGGVLIWIGAVWCAVVFVIGIVVTSGQLLDVGSRITCFPLHLLKFFEVGSNVAKQPCLFRGIGETIVVGYGPGNNDLLVPIVNLAGDHSLNGCVYGVCGPIGGRHRLHIIVLPMLLSGVNESRWSERDHIKRGLMHDGPQATGGYVPGIRNWCLNNISVQMQDWRTSNDVGSIGYVQGFFRGIGGTLGGVGRSAGQRIEVVRVGKEHVDCQCELRTKSN